MKKCRKCGREKPLEEFYKMAGMRDGHRNECKACNLAAKARRHQANPEPVRERARRWKRENPERDAANQAAFRTSGKKRVSDRKSHLRRKFGISLEDYEQLLQDQGGRCAICERPPREDIALHVDHEHGTGRIRGLLCFRCNNALGDLGDSRERLDAAAEYLDRTPENEELARRARERLADLRAEVRTVPLYEVTDSGLRPFATRQWSPLWISPQ